MRVSDDLIVDRVGIADPLHGWVVGSLPAAGEPFKLRPASPGGGDADTTRNVAPRIRSRDGPARALLDFGPFQPGGE